MKYSLALLVAIGFLGFAPAGNSAEDGKDKENASERRTDASPASANPPNSGAKPKRSGSPNPTAKQRHNANAEIKTFSFSNRFGSDRSTRPLVVRNAPADAKSTIQLQEDLAVMARVLEKNIAEYRDEHEEAAGIPILTLGVGKAVRALYLEDYGAVFTLNVNIPLKADPKPDDDDEKPENAAANEEWIQATNELFPQRRTTARGEKVTVRARRPFDQHQVDEFRETLLDALRNASNIRNLRDTDWITLVVRGRGSEVEIDGQFDVLIRGARENAPLQTAALDDPSGDASTMVLRIKKSAADEINRQKGSLDQFKQRVSVALY